MGLYERYQSLTFQAIENYVQDGQEEHLTLDFKCIANPKLSDKSDKRNLAKALSGFANSSGGLIVWGVDARKNNQGVDCASNICEIDGTKLLVTRLNDFTGQAVSPIVDNVQHRVLDREEDKGVVVSYIPESSSGPHMAKMGEDRYYKRSGDSFYRMEHFDIADMFGRRPQPKLELSTRIKEKGDRAEIVIGITNQGRGIAKAPFVALNVSHPFGVSPYGLDGNRNHGMRKLPIVPGKLPFRFGEGANEVIHPGITHEITIISCKLAYPGATDSLYKSDTVEIDYLVAADGFKREGKKVIPYNELGLSAPPQLTLNFD